MSLEGAEQLARIVNGLKELEDTYHHLPLEAPEVFAKIIRDFMNQTTT
ncbi:alpha/beta hydrolase [Filobacillus milosensis]|uniref:Alpha/beta hydrolase n=1 Tax=Filobacillus milosensis TaxID=94137 RepID=A0A4Y8IQF4_9BACI|nr:alpha/beta hydrolase [Filobacillus milosensis]TFB23902.1 alpha/beta hydrolase [Filobacillus milosensis]